MNLYRQLDDTYQQIRRKPVPIWLAGSGPDDLDRAVAAIRADVPDSTASDNVLRHLIDVGRREPEAMTVALYALAPKLRARLGRTVTDEYRSDVLTQLAFVLLDSPVDGTRLAARLVNRAHNRAHKADRRTRTHGIVNVTTVAPYGPEHFERVHSHDGDVAAIVAERVDLARFHAAVGDAIASGRLSEAAWGAYLEHRLRRAVDPDAPVSSSHQRITASRTARKLTPLVETYLHAA
ncbi:MAG TPA: hypothetical protein VFZ68_09710 [Acidimicrobiales bacterium]